MRLINADEFEVIGGVVPDEYDTDSYLAGCMEILNKIDEAPTIDAEPVRHGRWMNKGYITTAYGSIDTGDCSACGAVDVPIEPYDSHCPNCGAIMDLEVQDEV